ncbi:hypothetical protein, partial [Adlercreutzia sp. ZJ176]|uniref:hypothetical protein n=1 Tax=Adlercreutzia sp. ZJ176 TaxID=2709407 RepID=UPI00197CF35E
MKQENELMSASRQQNARIPRAARAQDACALTRLPARSAAPAPAPSAATPAAAPATAARSARPAHRGIP